MTDRLDLDPATLRRATDRFGRSLDLGTGIWSSQLVEGARATLTMSGGSTRAAAMSIKATFTAAVRSTRFEVGGFSMQAEGFMFCFTDLLSTLEGRYSMTAVAALGFGGSGNEIALLLATAAASMALTGASIAAASFDATGTASVTMYGSTTIDPTGYFAGGQTPYTAVMDALLFSTEARSTLSATLAAARGFLAGANSVVKGYFAGGYGGSNTNEIDGLDFTDESAINPSATLSSARSSLVAANSAQDGYFAGGNGSNVTDKLNFSGESISTLSATLAYTDSDAASMSSANYGYFPCGESHPQYTQKLQFSSDTYSVFSSTWSNTMYQRAGHNSASYGYMCAGGYTQPVSPYTTYYYDTISRIAFATDTGSNVSATLSTAKYGSYAANSSAKGYIAGGVTTGFTQLSEIEDIAYATETVGTLSATLSTTRDSGTGVQSGGLL